MKKFLIFLMAYLVPSVTFAQLAIDSLGNVRMGESDSNSRVSFNNSDSISTLYIKSNGKALNINTNGNLNGLNTPATGIYIMSMKTGNLFSKGIECYSLNLSNSSGGAYGLFGTALSSYDGHSYGVVGMTSGNHFGAGIYGTINGYSYVDGRYAGYFKGDVKVTGTINGTVISSSDMRLKENVHQFGSDKDCSVLDKLELLTPVTYNYKDTTKTSNNENVNWSDICEESQGLDSLDRSLLLEMEEGKEKPCQVLQKTHYGLIAQELQQVYPDLVYENDNGYLSINYTELIPIMLQSIKELNAKVEQLSSPAVRKAKAVETETTGVDAAIADAAGMDQNVPNPFSGKTDIAIYLPETVQTAMLYIYDLSGKQVEQHAIEGRGNTTMTIHADRMDAGMYIYSLIADGKVVATKRMIVVR